MRVLIVSPVAPLDMTQIGGTRSYTLGLLNALRVEGIDAWLAGLKGSENDGQGIDVSDRTSSGTFRFVFDVFRHCNRLFRLKPDVINIQLSLSGLVFLFCRIPLVVTMHGSPHRGVSARRGSFAGWVLLQFERMVLRHARRVIFVDDKTHGEYVRRFPWLRQKSVTIPVAIHTDEFQPVSAEQKIKLRRDKDIPQSASVLVYVGRLSQEKNVAGVINAFGKFHQRHPESVLIIIGDGPEFTGLQDLVSRLRLTDEVTFKKQLEHDQIARFLAISDLFVMASRHEGLSIAAVEALSCGIPLVATNVGDLHRLVSLHQTGELVDSADDLAEAIGCALGSPGESGWADGVAKDCRAKALEFSWAAIAQRLIEQYELTLNGRAESI